MLSSSRLIRLMCMRTKTGGSFSHGAHGGGRKGKPRACRYGTVDPGTFPEYEHVSHYFGWLWYMVERCCLRQTQVFSVQYVLLAMGVTRVMVTAIVQRSCTVVDTGGRRFKIRPCGFHPLTLSQLPIVKQLYLSDIGDILFKTPAGALSAISRFLHIQYEVFNGSKSEWLVSKVCHQLLFLS